MTRVVRNENVFLARYTADVDVIVTLKFESDVTYEDAFRHARAGVFDERAVQKAIDEGRARVVVKEGSVRLMSVAGNGHGG